MTTAAIKIKRPCYWVVPALSKGYVQQFVQRKSAAEITTYVCRTMGVHDSLVLKRGRRRRVVDCRHMCWHVIRRRTKLTMTEIARMFRVDHSTVVYGIKRFNDLMQFDEQLRNTARIIEENF